MKKIGHEVILAPDRGIIWNDTDGGSRRAWCATRRAGGQRPFVWLGIRRDHFRGAAKMVFGGFEKIILGFAGAIWNHFLVWRLQKVFCQDL